MLSWMCVESRLAKSAQFVFVEQRAAGYQIRVQVAGSRVPNQLDEILAQHRLAAREMELHDAEFGSLGNRCGTIRQSKVRREYARSRSDCCSKRIAADIDKSVPRRAYMDAARSSLEESSRANRFEESFDLELEAHRDRAPRNLSSQLVNDLIDRALAVAQAHDSGSGFIQEQGRFGKQQHFLIRDSDQTSAAPSMRAAAAMLRSAFMRICASRSRAAAETPERRKRSESHRGAPTGFGI